LSGSELGSRNKASSRAGHPGWSSSKDPGSSGRSGLGARVGAGSAEIEKINSTSLSNSEIHDTQRRVPNSMPQDVHMREPRITTGHGYHQSGTTGVETTENSSNSASGRPGYSKRSESEKPSKSISTLDTVPLTSASNNLPLRQKRSHGPRFPSIVARLNKSVPYAHSIQPIKLAGNRIPQEPGLMHEKATGWHDVEGWAGHLTSDDQSQQSPSTSTAPEPQDMTQGIDWQALNQALEHMIEKIYADDAKNRAESHSRKMAGRNHHGFKVAANDRVEEGSLVNENDLTDSKYLDDLDRLCIPMPVENLSAWPSVNIDTTVPYTEDSMSANVGRLHFREFYVDTRG
jgi:hypothetical protein